VSIVVFLLILVLLAAVVALVSAPIRARRAREGEVGEGSAAPQRGDPAATALLDDLRAEREAKYQEIRDAELDYRTGKLSREDYEAIDGGLRAEAIAILDRLQALEADGAATPRGA
jgi:uncharacterized protein YdbL (DUF1318 family)